MIKRLSSKERAKSKLGAEHLVSAKKRKTLSGASSEKRGKVLHQLITSHPTSQKENTSSQMMNGEPQGSFHKQRQPGHGLANSKPPASQKENKGHNKPQGSFQEQHQQGMYLHHYNHQPSALAMSAQVPVKEEDVDDEDDVEVYDMIDLCSDDGSEAEDTKLPAGKNANDGYAHVGPTLDTPSHVHVALFEHASLCTSHCQVSYCKQIKAYLHHSNHCRVSAPSIAPSQYTTFTS